MALKPPFTCHLRPWPKAYRVSSRRKFRGGGENFHRVDHVRVSYTQRVCSPSFYIFITSITDGFITRYGALYGDERLVTQAFVSDAYQPVRITFSSATKCKIQSKQPRL